jgi:hypothetical protein
MTENPYRLTRDVRGIGFKTARSIAMRLGIEKTAMIRLRVGISSAFDEAVDFELPCEFAFAIRQIEIRTDQGLSYARSAIENFVIHN